MRPICKKPIIIRGREIGGRYPLACLPLIASDLKSLLEQARETVLKSPDLIEWRIDSYLPADGNKPILTALRGLRQAAGDIPLILTCRSIKEGGIHDVPLDSRIEMMTALMQTGLADIVDFEIANGESAVMKIVQAARANQARLILSCHDFAGTPEPAIMTEMLAKAERLGADIAKLATMPENYQDVLDLLGATLKARSEFVTIPIITMAMGDLGRLSRIAGALFGSDVSFALGRHSSAPGQIPIELLRQGWELLAL